MTTATQEAAPVTEPQQAFDESPLEDDAILNVLEKWQTAFDNLAAAQDEVRDVEKMLQALVSQKELDEGTYRSGRFVVRISNVAAHQRVRPQLAKTK